MTMTTEAEFRYISQWFLEWSELQREDFVPVLIELFSPTEADGGVYMNGVINSVENATIVDKPMSLFQCRIKLFREWSPKWPMDLRHKLKEKIIEIDSQVGEKIINELKKHNDDHTGANGNELETESETAEVKAEDTVVNTAAVVIVTAADESIDIDNRLAAVIENETPVDGDTDENEDNMPTIAEPDEPVPAVQMPAQEDVVSSSVVVVQAVASIAEVPLVA